MNYTPAPPLPSEQRLARLQTWLALTIAWFAGHVLALIAPQAAARELARLSRWARILLIVRALKRTPERRAPGPRCYDNHSRKRELTHRRMAGARLRRALKTRSPLERARALYAALTKAETWITRLLRRFTRRFSKLRRLRHRTSAAVMLCAAYATRFFADTS